VLLTEGLSRLFGVSRRARYRFPFVTDIQWKRAGDENWQTGHSLNLSATGIYFEHSELKLNLGDKVDIAIAAATPSTNATDDQNAGSLVADRARIAFQGHVVNSYMIGEQISQRLGIFIDQFNTESDANNYSYLVHNPLQLLRGEEYFLHPADEPVVAGKGLKPKASKITGLQYP
jgi:hypothetical protein